MSSITQNATEQYKVLMDNGDPLMKPVQVLYRKIQAILVTARLIST